MEGGVASRLNGIHVVQHEKITTLPHNPITSDTSQFSLFESRYSFESFIDQLQLDQHLLSWQSKGYSRGVTKTQFARMLHFLSLELQPQELEVRYSTFFLFSLYLVYTNLELVSNTRRIVNLLLDILETGQSLCFLSVRTERRGYVTDS